MADGERLGASFSIDITALKTGLQQANRLIKESNSEFKAAAAGLDDWTASEEGLTAKLKNLNDVATLQEKKVEALKKEYERCIANGLDPMSSAAVKMRTDINNEKAALEKTRAEAKKYQTQLDGLADATDEAGDEAQEAADNFDDLGDAAKNSSDGFTVAKGAMADLVSNGIQALAGACKNAISSVMGLADETRESRTEFAKLEASFQTAGLGAEAAEKTITELYGILGDTGQATEASNLIAKMSKNQEDLETNTRILTGVFSEYGASIPVEGLAEAMSSTAAMGSVQSVLADALEWQGINLDSYNEKLATMTTEEERAAYIQDTLTGLYGESADAYRENNSALIEANETQLEYEKTLNSFGETAEPITTKVKDGFNSLLEKVLELVEDVDMEKFGETIDTAFSTLNDTLDTLATDVLPVILDAFKWIKDHGEEVIALLAGIAAGFLAFEVASIINAVTTALTAAGGALAFLNTTMLASPITWIAVGIGALVAAIVLLIANWDKVKEAGAAAWEWIKGAWDKASTWFDETIIQPIVGFFKGLWESVSGFFTDLWEDIKAIWNTVSNWFNENVIEPVVDFFKGLWESVSGFFADLWEDIKSVWNTVSNWFNEHVIEPVANFFSDLWDSLKEKASDAWEGVKGVFKSVGNFFGGIWDTIKEKFTTIGTKVADAIGGAFKSAINAVITVVENGLNVIPRTINKALKLINKLPNVNIANMSTISLPRLAKGGVVSRATTAIVGEDGKEAIVPLERNTEWIDKVADKISAKQAVVVNQTNNYSQAHSRYEIYKSKVQTAAAVRLALQGV